MERRNIELLVDNGQYRVNDTSGVGLMAEAMALYMDLEANYPPESIAVIADALKLMAESFSRL